MQQNLFSACSTPRCEAEIGGNAAEIGGNAAEIPGKQTVLRRFCFGCGFLFGLRLIFWNAAGISSAMRCGRNFRRRKFYVWDEFATFSKGYVRAKVGICTVFTAFVGFACSQFSRFSRVLPFSQCSRFLQFSWFSRFLPFSWFLRSSRFRDFRVFAFSVAQSA